MMFLLFLVHSAGHERASVFFGTGAQTMSSHSTPSHSFTLRRLNKFKWGRYWQTMTQRINTTPTLIFRCTRTEMIESIYCELQGYSGLCLCSDFKEHTGLLMPCSVNKEKQEQNSLEELP